MIVFNTIEPWQRTLRCIFTAMALWLLFAASPVLAQESMMSAPQTPVSDLLNADGTINLNNGFSGNLDLNGYHMVNGPNGEPRFVPINQPQPTSAPAHLSSAGDGLWDDQFSGSGVSGANNNVLTTAIIGGELYIGGYFTTVGNAAAKSIAKWDGTSWQALGAGLNFNVIAIIEFNGFIYAGGQFSSTGDGSVTGLNYIAKWDGSNWTPVGSGFNNAVRDFAILGGELYAAGDFTQTGDGSVTGLNYIAKWDGSNWAALGTGFNSIVFSLTLIGTDIYAGGWFTKTADNSVTLNHIAKWDGTSWSALGTGLSATIGIFTTTTNGTDLYVGGDFTQTADGSVTLNRIAKWDGSSWSALGSGLNSPVRSLTAIGTDIYAGGEFIQTADGSVTGLNRIAKWNGTSWSALGAGLDVELYRAVNALSSSGTDLYAGGSFSQTGDGSIVGLNNIAKWDGSSWSILGTRGKGLFLPNSSVNSMVVSNGILYIGGSFTQTADGSVTLNRIATWDGSNWSTLGSGLNRIVRSLTFIGTDLYVGGDFTQTADGSVTGLNRVAKWDGSNWSAVGNGLNASVNALTTLGSDLYAGGNFTLSGDGSVSLNRIAKWDGSSWAAVGAGLNSSVYAMTVISSDLYVAGFFVQTADGSVTGLNRIAKWDGSNWTAVGLGFNDLVWSLTTIGSDLYAGGRFTQSGDGLLELDYIAKWDGSNWATVGPGFNSDVQAMTTIGNDIYAGGNFTETGDGSVTLNRIAKWDGSTWSPLGSGLDNIAQSITGMDNDIYVGGFFTVAGGKPSLYIGRYICDTPPPAELDICAEIDVLIGEVDALILDPGTPRKARKKLEKAKNYLNNGCDNFTAGEYDRGFNDLADAADELDKAMDKGADAGAIRIATVDLARLIATETIADAQAYAGDPAIDHLLNKAAEALADGDAERADDKFDKAVKEYGKAWEYAAEAIQLANDTGTGGEISMDLDPVLNAIDALLANNPNKKARKALQKAHGKVTDAQSKYDNGDIEDGYGKLEDAVGYLEDAADEGSDADPAIAELLTLGRDYAVAKITEAQTYAGTPEVDQQITKAQNYLSDGDAAAAQGKNEKAMDRYGKAWTEAQEGVLLGNGLGKTTVDPLVEIPTRFGLEQNYPNPFNPTTVISYQLSAVSNVKLVIYNTLGQQVRTLVSGSQNTGSYTVQWDGRSDLGEKVASGMYLYRITAGSFVQTKKMMLMK